MSPSKRLSQAFTADISKLSFGKLVALASGVLTLVALLSGAARMVSHIETKAHADSVYVRKDTFAIHQQGEAAVHTRDSLIISAAVDAITKDVATLVRACQAKKECP